MPARYYYTAIISFLICNYNALAAITCSNPVETCVEAGGTRDFNGASIYLPCWKYKTTYECKADSDNNCQPLITAGCSPATSTCKTMHGNVCAVKETTYDCPTRKCDGMDIVCNNPNTFCATGDCASQVRSQDQDMHQSLAALSAMAEAAKLIDKIDSNNMKIFTGKAIECSYDVAGAKNCCRTSRNGFLEGVILSCSDDEKKLAIAKEDRKTIELGEYCHNKPLGLACITYHKTYCVFGSKLARIIQGAARVQLGVSFGDAKHSHCQGLSPEQFQKLDFSKIDFSEFYQDIVDKTTRSTVGDVKQKAEKYANEVKGDTEKMREKMQNKFKTSHQEAETLNDKVVQSRDPK